MWHSVISGCCRNHAFTTPLVWKELLSWTKENASGSGNTKTSQNFHVGIPLKSAGLIHQLLDPCFSNPVSCDGCCHSLATDAHAFQYKLPTCLSCSTLIYGFECPLLSSSSIVHLGRPLLDLSPVDPVSWCRWIHRNTVGFKIIIPPLLDISTLGSPPK